MAVRKVASSKKKVVDKGRARKAEALEVKASSASLANRLREFRISRKTRYTVLTLLALALLLFLGSRYLVVAWVDGKPITRFEYYNAMDKKYGSPTRENLIVEKLFLSEASKRKVNVTDQDINNEIAKIEKQQGGREQLNQALEANNISRDELNTRIKLELLKEKMFGAGVTVSDQEFDKYIEDNKSSLPSTLTDTASSESAKLRDNLRQQLKQQKVDQEFNKWLTEALKSSRVIRI